MPDGAPAHPSHIFIIEDFEDEYNIVHDFVTDAIVGKSPRPVVERIYSRDGIEQRLSELKDRAKVLIIFDRLLEPTDTNASTVSLDDYITRYQVTLPRLRLAKKDAIIMHPGPIIRGLELTWEVADCRQSVIVEEVRNGVPVRMAVLTRALGGRR